MIRHSHPAPLAADDPVMILRAKVLDLRRAYANSVPIRTSTQVPTLDDLYAAVDVYLDACEVKAKRLWPNRKYRRPSRAWILRAL